MACLKMQLIDFVFHLRPGRRSTYASEVSVATSADVVLLAPDRTEARFTDQVFSVLAHCELLQKTCGAQVLFKQRQRKCQLHPAQFRVPGAGDG